MYTICILYVYYMYIICILYVLLFILQVYYVYTAHCMYVCFGGLLSMKVSLHRSCVFYLCVCCVDSCVYLIM